MRYDLPKTKPINSEALRLQLLEVGITTFVENETMITLYIEPYQKNDVDRIWAKHKPSDIVAVEPSSKIITIQADGVDGCRFIVSGDGDVKPVYINDEEVYIELENGIGAFTLSSETVGVITVMVDATQTKVAAV